MSLRRMLGHSYWQNHNRCYCTFCQDPGQKPKRAQRHREKRQWRRDDIDLTDPVFNTRGGKTFIDNLREGAPHLLPPDDPA